MLRRVIVTVVKYAAKKKLVITTQNRRSDIAQQGIMLKGDRLY